MICAFSILPLSKIFRKERKLKLGPGSLRIAVKDQGGGEAELIRSAFYKDPSAVGWRMDWRAARKTFICFCARMTTNKGLDD